MTMTEKRIHGSALLCLICLNSVALSMPLSDRGMRHLSLKKDGASSPNQIGRGKQDQAYIPADWRKVPAEEGRPEPPKVEIRLLKGHVSPWNERWSFSNEYIYSPKGYQAKPGRYEEMNRIPDDGKKAGKGKTERVDKNAASTELTPRGIIGGPTFEPERCPPGQRFEGGKCREIIEI